MEANQAPDAAVQLLRQTRTLQAPLRVGILGTGAWGRNQLRAFRNEPRCEVTYFVDADAAARNCAQAIAPNAHALDDAEALMASDVQAIVIATPAPSHDEFALRAIAAGKHVLVEKPLALSFRQAQAIAGAPRQPGQIVMVGHLMVYHPVVARLRELLRTGTLGTLHYLHATRVNLGRVRRDENALWSLGPHDLSMIDYLLAREVTSVSARGQCVLQPNVQDVVFVTLRFVDGTMAHLHLSWLSPRKERRLTLVCSQKMVEFDDVAVDKLKVYDKGYDRPPEFTQFDQYLTIRDGDVFIPQVAMTEPLRVQTAHFVDCITTATEPLTDVASGVRVVRLLEAAQRSLLADGAPIALSEVV